MGRFCCCYALPPNHSSLILPSYTEIDVFEFQLVHTIKPNPSSLIFFSVSQLWILGICWHVCGFISYHCKIIFPILHSPTYLVGRLFSALSQWLQQIILQPISLLVIDPSIGFFSFQIEKLLEINTVHFRVYIDVGICELASSIARAHIYIILQFHVIRKMIKCYD